MSRIKKYKLIESELRKAKKKHPVWPLDMFKQLAIVNEEAGKVTKAVLHYKREGGSLEYLKTELRLTAAMCIRMLENLPK